jgi:NAD+ diphosphatase
VSVLVVSAGRILVDDDGRLVRLRDVPAEAREPHGGPLVLEGIRGGLRVVDWPDPAAPPPSGRFLGLRASLGTLAVDEARLAGRARQLLEWRQHHRFCGRCGVETRLEGGSALRCPSCGLDHFPRVAPAVIVLVHDGDRALLGRHPGLPEGMYSTLAGFVEPGESAEDTVHREIHEESGVTVEDLRYQGSQSWPFPHSLMLGYLARYRGGELVREEEELEDLAWFRRDALPRIPPPVTIARTLIDAWLEGQRG